MSITASANPPRGAFVDYPLGSTAGQPGNVGDQTDIARRALGLLESIDESGTIVSLDKVWPTEWKTEARSLADHRSERFDTPQYQTDADRSAAIDRHGQVAACEICEAATTPQN